MAKLPRFAKVFAGRRRIVEMDISLRLRNLAEFFNSLLGRHCVGLHSITGRWHEHPWTSRSALC